jgi:hypothetical protein
LLVAVAVALHQVVMVAVVVLVECLYHLGFLFQLAHIQ